MSLYISAVESLAEFAAKIPAEAGRAPVAAGELVRGRSAGKLTAAQQIQTMAEAGESATEIAVAVPVALTEVDAALDIASGTSGESSSLAGRLSVEG